MSINRHHNLKTLIILLLTVCSTVMLKATTYYSIGSFEASYLSTWSINRSGGGAAPPSFNLADSFVVQATHSVFAARNWVLRGANSAIIIESGGILKAIDSINVTPTTVFNIKTGGSYFHMNSSNAPTAIFNGIEVFEAKSNVDISNWKSYTVPIPVSVFGNLRISYVPASVWNQQNNISRIDGNFILDNRSSVAFQFANNNNYTLTITKNFLLKSGLFNFSGPYSKVYQMNVGGGLWQSGGILTNPVGSSSPSIWKINFTGDSSFVYRSAGTFTNSQINYSVQASAYLYLGRQLPIALSRRIDIFGTIVCDTNKVSGRGTFYLRDNGSMYIGADSGITLPGSSQGNIVTTFRSYSIKANYVYYGRNEQITGSGLPITVKGLKVRFVNTLQTLTILSDITVTDSLCLVGGIVNSNNFLITLGTASIASRLGNLLQVSGFINGDFQRYFAPTTNAGTTGLFPIGIEFVYRPIKIEFTIASVNGGLIKASFINSDPGSAGLTLRDGSVDLMDVSTTGWWRMEVVDGDFRAGQYSCTIYPNYFPDVLDPNILHIVSRQAGGSWVLDGTHTPSSGTSSNPIANRINMTKIAEIGFSSSNHTSALPVSWNDFQVNAKETDAILHWSTNIEVNTDYYDIEKSFDGLNYSSIGQVAAAGNSSSLESYMLADEDALNVDVPTIYYRIRQVDKDSKYTYSAVKYLNIKPHSVALETTNSLLVYPNPSNGIIKVEGNQEIQRISIISLVGELKQLTTVNAKEMVIDLSDLPIGMYVLRADFIDNSVKSSLIIKN